MVNLVFGLDVSMLGDAEVDAHPGTIGLRQVEARIVQGLPGAVNGNRPRPGAAPPFLLLLIPQFVKIANPRQDLAHVPGFELPDSRLALQQVLPELLQVVPVRRRQPHPGNDDSIFRPDPVFHS